MRRASARVPQLGGVYLRNTVVDWLIALGDRVLRCQASRDKFRSLEHEAANPIAQKANPGSICYQRKHQPHYWPRMLRD